MSLLVVALGNPGTEYELTKHNIAWLALDQLDYDLIWKEKFKGLYAKKEINGESVYFLKPHTYMNLSGESVQPLCQFFKIDISEVLVIHDELDLSYGHVQFKSGGGLAGHNGLKSIAQKMGTQDFYRLRLGIGRPARGSVSNYVLSAFSPEQDVHLEKYLMSSADCIKDFIDNGFEKVQRKYNKKQLI